MPSLDQHIHPDSILALRLQQADLPVWACYQCRKCASGCPLTFAMDLLPDQVIRLAQMGQEDLLFAAHTPWVCSACETCTTRCPNGIDIAGVMDWLKQEALKRRPQLPEPQVAAFHQSFLHAVRWGGGRLSEPLVLALFALSSGQTLEKLRSGALKEDLLLAWELARRGRLKLRLPQTSPGTPEIKKIFAQSQ